jgi:hypothetical protein
MDYPKNKGGQYIVPPGTDVTDFEPGTFVVQGAGIGADETPHVAETPAEAPAETPVASSPEAAAEAPAEVPAEDAAPEATA